MQDLSNRFKGAKRTTDKAIEKYGKENVSQTGHSLGGSQAIYAGAKRGLTTHAFNAGVSPVDVARSKGVFNSKLLQPFLGKLNYHKDIHHHTTSKDLVGGLGKYVKGLNTHVVNQKHTNAHSIKNFY